MPSVITLLMTKPESLDSWWSADENLSVKKALPHVEAGATDLGWNNCYQRSVSEDVF